VEREDRENRGMRPRNRRVFGESEISGSVLAALASFGGFGSPKHRCFFGFQ
jgi:hypothetical protein